MIPMTDQLVKQAIFGKRVQNDLVQNTDGLSDLIDHLKKEFNTKGYVETLGGRRLIPDSSHKILNYMNQGMGAEAMKYYIIELVSGLKDVGLIQGIDYHIQAIIYDEVDTLVRAKDVDKYKEVLLNSFTAISRKLNMKTTYTGEVMIGGSDDKHPNNWFGCHQINTIIT